MRLFVTPCSSMPANAARIREIWLTQCHMTLMSETPSGATHPIRQSRYVHPIRSLFTYAALMLLGIMGIAICDYLTPHAAYLNRGSAPVAGNSQPAIVDVSPATRADDALSNSMTFYFSGQELAVPNVSPACVQHLQEGQALTQAQVSRLIGCEMNAIMEQAKQLPSSNGP